MNIELQSITDVKHVGFVKNQVIPMELPTQEWACKRIQTLGKISHRSEPKSTPEDFVSKWAIKAHHESLLEFVSVTLIIKCSRAIANEIVRHRIGVSHLQESTRYVNYNKKEIEFIEPTEEVAIFKYAYQVAYNQYVTLIHRGITPEYARNVLPLGLATTIAVEMNFRAWRHFLKLRTDKTAHPEMREVAGIIKQLLQETYPVIFPNEEE